MTKLDAFVDFSAIAGCWERGCACRTGVHAVAKLERRWTGTKLEAGMQRREAWKLGNRASR